MNFLAPHNLFQVPPTNPPWPFAVMTAVLAVIFLGSLIAYWRRVAFSGGNAVRRRFIRRAATSLMWVSGIGLALAAVRYLQIDYLDMPFWIYLDWIVLFIVAAYFVYDRSERYPLAVWRLSHAESQRQYRPPRRQQARSGARPVTNRPRGKRKR